jgi:diaminohydroxyphosphoribosylaminopyrimidine deaminase/5-amino-6-(5-phosphoribosylamino)uracil reductase
MSNVDRQWMARALELAERGRGAVEPNPLVGAVAVRGGVAVGEGWHERYGAAHAEVHALARAGEAACGATLYVTLEPCCHHGKTPPCADAVIRAGIVRVVSAMSDPFPQVAGQGFARLRAAGVAVDVGVGEAEARRLNAPYLKLLATGMPYVHAKWAMTLDGKIATRAGHSKWVSNRASRQLVHGLRGRMDAVVVGIGTALADDPLLTARPPGLRTAVRVILDSGGRLPVTAQLARTVGEAPVLVVTGGQNEATEALRQRGCEVLPLPGLDGRPDVVAVLRELGRRRMTNVLVEGGAAVLGSFLDAGAVDEVHVFIAPRLAGGARALSPVGGVGVAALADGLALTGWTATTVGDGPAPDVYLHGWRNPVQAVTVSAL